jgi:hypothetical protein
MTPFQQKSTSEREIIVVFVGKYASLSTVFKKIQTYNHNFDTSMRHKWLPQHVEICHNL